MKKLLYISNAVKSEAKNARSTMAKKHFELLTEILGKDSCILYPVRFRRKTWWEKIKNIFYQNRYAGMSIEEEDRIIKTIKQKEIDAVLIDTSSWGYLIEHIKTCTDCLCIVFLQDIEYYRCKTIRRDTFSTGNYKAYFRYKLQQHMAELNEKKAVFYADYLIAYTERDSKLLQIKYKKNVDLILPLFVENIQIKEKLPDSPYCKSSKSLLFVSVLSYEPNLIGIRWFIEKVYPFIHGYSLYIVGSDSEKFRDELEGEGVHVEGMVEDLSSYYLNADIVILPLFCGGGMKYKTVEAMSFGKTIVGTKEAFAGYKLNSSKIGGLCNTAEEWINCLNSLNTNKYNDYSRNIFLNKYSKDIIKEQFEAFFASFENGKASFLE